MYWQERKRPARRANLRILPREEPPPLPDRPSPRVDRLALFSGTIAAGVVVLGLGIPMQVSRLGGPLPWGWGSWAGAYFGVLGLGLGLLSGLTWGMELDRRWFWAGFGAPLALGIAWAGGILALGGV